MNGMSDHQMIITTINARPKIIRNKPRKVYLYKKGNLDAVKEYLDSKLESFKEKYKEMNIEGYWTTFKSHLFNAMDQYIPSKTLTSRWNIPWINQNIKNMVLIPLLFLSFMILRTSSIFSLFDSYLVG
jgi:hypothetical protein